MKKTATLFMLAVLLSPPQAASAANFYWGISLVGSAFETGALKVDIKDANGYSPQRLSLGGEKRHYAAGASIFYGLDFAWAGSIPLRLELESSLRNGGSVTKRKNVSTGGSLLQAADVEAELDIGLNFWQGLNLWLDIPVGGLPVKPYLGGGLGVNIISYDTELCLNPGRNAIESLDSDKHYDYAIGYQLGAGARLPLAKRAFLDIGLRYLQKKDWEIKMSPFDLEFSTRSFNLTVGFNYYF